MPRPVLIAIVGIDGAGKTTLARQLARDLAEAGVPAAYYENAGGRPVISRIARAFGRADGPALLGRGGNLLAEATIRWLAIARTVLGARLGGRVAVMDRYAYCQYAAIRTRGQRGERLARLAYRLFPRPDVVCYLAVDPAEAQRRVELRGIDREELAYLCAADAAYRGLPEFAGFTVVDAHGSPDEVRAAVRGAALPTLRANRTVTLPRRG
ncbi:dTMP kinase [Catellatospora sp. KI3]|uniref:dTMP kinase n=1 Tax=Catellatospora sp. KI3 TaxID=3041620 RepID=UPI002482B0C4|nr:dTMP kinase [Catellatospora sp. KI3]MDI1461530.1 dTMP kinase [Catellatospora sp. KI3]